MTARADEPYRWLTVPHWYLWEGGFLVTGSAQGVIRAHAHHAIQIVLAFDGAVAIAGPDAVWHTSRGAIVRADVEHSFDCNGATAAMVFVDPESREGAWLQASLPDDLTLMDAARLDPLLAALFPLTQSERALDIAALVRGVVHGLGTGAMPAHRLDPRVTAVLDTMRASDSLRLSLDDAADKACLSPSRFAHLFREQVGLPFSRYMLWRKLTRAMVAVGSERTLAAAAQAADFSDAAHLTRTFYQMVGIAPSALMQGRLDEIASPFDTSIAVNPVRPFPRARE